MKGKFPNATRMRQCHTATDFWQCRTGRCGTVCRQLIRQPAGSRIKATWILEMHPPANHWYDTCNTVLLPVVLQAMAISIWCSMAIDIPCRRCWAGTMRMNGLLLQGDGNGNFKDPVASLSGIYVPREWQNNPATLVINNTLNGRHHKIKDHCFYSGWPLPAIK